MTGFTHILDEAFETAVKGTANLCASRFEPLWLLHSVAATSVWKGVEYSRPVCASRSLLGHYALSTRCHGSGAGKRHGYRHCAERVRRTCAASGGAGWRSSGADG